MESVNHVAARNYKISHPAIYRAGRIRVKKQTWFSVGLILAPILVFYALLIRETLNIPFLDDYYAVLRFVTNWSRLHTAHEKALDLLTSQHNEYKLIFENVLLAS